jgi:hypothetical protein
MSDPITDPNDPNYDARKDPNSPEYDPTTDPNYDATQDPNSPQYAGPEVQPRGEPVPAEGEPVEGEPRPKVWQDYANRAIFALYPHLREGVDYAWGVRKAGDTPEMLEMSDKYAPLDMGKVEEVATNIMKSDPYANPEVKPTVPGVAPYSTAR